MPRYKIKTAEISYRVYYVDADDVITALQIYDAEDGVEVDSLTEVESIVKVEPPLTLDTV